MEEKNLVFIVDAGIMGQFPSQLREFLNARNDIVVTDRMLDFDAPDPTCGTCTRTYSTDEIFQSECTKREREINAWNRNVEAEKTAKRRSKGKW